MRHDRFYRCHLGNSDQVAFGTASGYALNSANIWHGHTFWVHEAKNVTEISVYIYSKTGSPTYGNYQMGIQEIDPATGNPTGIDIATTTATATGSYVGNTYNVWQFSSPVALTAGKQYWFYLKYLVTDASNYISAGTGGTTVGNLNIGLAQGCSSVGLYTSNAGSTYTRAAFNYFWRVSYDDGTASGLPVKYSFTNSIGGNNWGTTYTIPYGLRMKLQCVMIGCYRSGTYTGTWVMQIRKASESGTVIATSTNSYSFAMFSTAGGSPTPFYFDDVILEQNTKYIFTLYCSSGTALGILAASAQMENFGAYIRTLKEQIGGNVVHDLTAEYSEDAYRSYVVKLSLLGDYVNPFYAKTKCVASV